MTAGIASAGDSVRATGRFMYFQNGLNGGAQLPLVGARVYLIDDDDLSLDDTMATGYTDANGNYDLSGSEDDGWGDPDPYVRVELETFNGNVVVESEIFKINVTCDTPVRNETSGNISFGTRACDGDGRDASTIFANLRNAYSSFKNLSGDSQIPRHNGKAAALFPVTFAAGVPWTTEESIHWPGGYRTFKSVYHEFGHRIRHAQDGDFGHFLGDVAAFTYTQQHWFTKVTNAGFAFNEGWAAYVSAVHGADDFSGWTQVSGGNNVEGNVAAKLWRAHQACGGFARLWGSLKKGGNNIHSWSQFATRLKADMVLDNATTKYPKCLSTLVATREDGVEPREQYAMHELLPGAPVYVGALAPNLAAGAEPAVAESDQRSAMRRLGAAAKTQASSRKYGRPFKKYATMKTLGDRMVSSRKSYEERSADKFQAYADKLTPIESTKEAVERRRAEHESFVKEIMQDRVALLEGQLKELANSKNTFKAGSREGVALDEALAKLEKHLSALRAAAKTGKMERRFLPASFRLATAELTPDGKK